MRQAFLDALSARAEQGDPVTFWLRDDDAVDPGPALDRLLAMTVAQGVPVTLAVIPERTGPALAARLATEPLVTVAQHGWAHRNHAGPGEKKQELGLHRPLPTILDELRQGRARLAALHPDRFLAVLVPPWNRIAPEVVACLPDAGLAALSVFGPGRTGPVRQVNTHVDLIDWRGTGGGRDENALLADVVSAMADGGPVGILTHHLVHDAAAWRFLATLITLVTDHPGAVWAGLPTLLGERNGDGQETVTSLA